MAMARSSKLKTLQTIVLFCCACLCNLIQSQSRDFYSTRLQSPSFSCLSTANASASFHNHVNLLLSDFNVQSSLSNYYKTSIGRSPDTVYGYFMCRADVTHQTCNDCIHTGTHFATEAGCDHVDGILFLELCFFQYTSDSMYNVRAPNLDSYYDFYKANVSNYDQFNRTLSPTLEALINKNAFSTNNSEFRPGFATMEAAVSGHEKIYSLAQCTPDILGANCSQCLRSALSILMSVDGSPGAISIKPPCQLRYDNNSFYYVGDSNLSEREHIRSPDLTILYSILLVFVYYLLN
ncbi:Cysteine-rich repeat secretory protein 8 [Bienertia sinuspersici]